MWMCFSCLQHCVILWPLDVSLDSTYTLRLIRDVRDLLVVGITSFDEWFAIPTVWCSPLRAFLLFREACHLRNPSVHLLQTGIEKPFLTYAAECAFWNLKGHIFRKLLRHEFGEIAPAGATESELQLRAIRLIKGCDDLIAADYLEQRAHCKEFDEEDCKLLGSEEAIPFAVRAFFQSSNGKKMLLLCCFLSVFVWAFCWFPAWSSASAGVCVSACQESMVNAWGRGALAQLQLLGHSR